MKNLCPKLFNMNCLFCNKKIGTCTDSTYIFNIYECMDTCSVYFVYKYNELIELTFITNNGTLSFLKKPNDDIFLIIKEGVKEKFKIKQHETIEKLLEKIKPANVEHIYRKMIKTYSLLK